MVSSSTVESDASLVSDIFSNYNSGITAITNDSVWAGKSKENALEQMNNFVNKYNSQITNQLSTFAGAIEKYEDYKKKKEELDTINEKIISLKTSMNADRSDLGNLEYKYKNLKNEIEDLKKEIKADIESVESQRIELDSTKLNPSSKYSLGDFINYYQGDYHQSYGYGSTIASAGCGPTSMAMVTTYLTGEKHDPVELSNWSLQRGYHIPNNGTAWAFFPAVAKAYGLDCEQSGVSSSKIKESLSNGKMIIMNVGPGTFTSGGHYIVLKGLTSDGRVIVADPASRPRSDKAYNMSVFLNEGKGMWSISTDKTSQLEI
jgi:hypothetical protein